MMSDKVCLAGRLRFLNTVNININDQPKKLDQPKYFRGSKSVITFNYIICLWWQIANPLGYIIFFYRAELLALITQYNMIL